MSDSVIPRLEMTIPRSTHYLGVVRKVVAVTAERVGFPIEEVDKIELAIDEACSNAVVHRRPGCPPELRVEVEVQEDRFVILLRDGGPPFPFDERGNFKIEDKLSTADSGGLGIYIIKNFMDEVSYDHSEESGSVIRMVKYRQVAAV